MLDLLPRTTRELYLVLALSALFLLLTFVAGALFEPRAALYPIQLIGLGLVAGLALGYGGYAVITKRVDLWVLQATLMRLRSQRLPPTLSFGRGGVTHLSQCVAALATTCGALLGPSMRSSASSFAPLSHKALANDLFDLHQGLVGFAGRLATIDKRLSDEWRLPLTESTWVALAEGTTTLVAATAQLQLGIGLPGAACYAAYQQSWLTGANLITGLIDHDATGAWIPGPNFEAVDMATVLRQTRRI